MIELENKVWNCPHFLFWSGFKIENTTNTKLQEGKQTLMKLRSYSKKKIVEKEQQGSKGISDANAKVDSDAEEMEITPSTPGFVEEVSVKESMGTMSLQHPETPVIKNTYAHAKSFETTKWRPKTRLTNKLHLNMKKMLNPNLQREKLIEIEESSSE